MNYAKNAFLMEAVSAFCWSYWTYGRSSPIF